MKKVCKVCNVEKEITDFTKHQQWYLKTCKECRQKKRRTGNPPHRFVKGHTPAMKGTKYTKIKCISSRMSGAYKGWKDLVKERDGHKCVMCGKTDNLHCHHIIPWKENPELRYSVSNGQTLCASHHASIEMKGKSWNRGKVRTPEMKQRISEAKKGCKAWNKDLNGVVKFSDDTKKKISESIKKNWEKRKNSQNQN